MVAGLSGEVGLLARRSGHDHLLWVLDLLELLFLLPEMDLLGLGLHSYRRDAFLFFVIISLLFFIF